MLLGALATHATSQIVIEVAPPGNVQALTLAGSTEIAVGVPIDIVVEGEPGASAVVLASLGTGEESLAIGTFLLDSTSLIGSYDVTIGPSGIGSTLDEVPMLALGDTFYLQAAIFEADGDIRLSNRCTFVFTDFTAPTVDQIELDPVMSPTAGSSVLLSGTVTQSGSSVRVTGGAATVTTVAAGGAEGTEFSVSVPLKSNFVNKLTVTEFDDQGSLSVPAPVSVIQDSQPPKLFIDYPTPASVVFEDEVTVVGRVADTLSGFMGLVVTVNGVDAAVNIGIGTNGTFEAVVSLAAPGVPTPITATATDEVGNTAVLTSEATQVAPTGTFIAKVGGGGQTGGVQSKLDDPISVRIELADGSPLANKVVTFRVVKSDGKLAADPSSPGTQSLQVATDATGVASAQWTLGSDAGCGNNRVEVTSVGVSGSVFFCATAEAGEAKQINIGSGDNQVGAAGATLPEKLRVWVSDSCNGIVGVPVTFTVEKGDSYITAGGSPPTTSITVFSGPTGHAEVACTLGVSPGTTSVRASMPFAEAAVRFEATGILGTVGAPTVFRGVVQNNANEGIGGADCMLVFEASGNVYSAFTSPTGFFEIGPIPEAGAAHLFVEGEVATSVGGQPVGFGSFPSLEFVVLVVEGAENGLDRAILLPALAVENDTPYSTTETTILTIEDVEGLRMEVAPGSMRFADGSPAPDGTLLALNRVNADDIPMPMTDGASPPFAWTLQPSGAHFDPPIRIVYPNMSGLAPNAVAYFLSFDHATGQFEIVATGSVSADGSEITTDAGDGLTTAGWGCNCPPYAVTQDCERCTEDCSEGSLSGGLVTVQQSASGATFMAVGVTDNGGTKTITCPDGRVTMSRIPPGSISYTYELKAPDGTVTTGSGASVSVPASECGTYTATFTAEANRECAPSPVTVGPASYATSAGPQASVNVDLGNLGPVVSIIENFVQTMNVGEVEVMGMAAFEGTATEICCDETSNGILTQGVIDAALNVSSEVDIPVPGLSTPPIPIIGSIGVQLEIAANANVSVSNGGLAYDSCAEELTAGGSAAAVVDLSAAVEIDLTIVEVSGGLATQMSVMGTITGTPAGVLLEANGSWGSLTGFIELEIDPPGGLWTPFTYGYTWDLFEGKSLSVTELILTPSQL